MSSDAEFSERLRRLADQTSRAPCDDAARYDEFMIVLDQLVENVHELRWRIADPERP